MLNEFCVITGAVSASFEKTWEEYEQLIFKYSPLEEKREIKKLLSEYQAKESECAGDFLSTAVMVGVCIHFIIPTDRRTLYALRLLSVHLGRGKRQALVTVFEVYIYKYVNFAHACMFMFLYRQHVYRSHSS